MQTPARLLALLLCLCLGVGCAGKEPAPDDEPAVERETVEQKPDAKQHIERAQSWFPSDTYAVGAMTAEQYWAFAGSFFPEGRRDLQTEEPGTLGGLRSDIRDMLLEEIGVDLTGLDGVVLGVGHDSGGAVLFGDIGLEDERFEREEMAGREVLRYQPEGMSTPDDDSIWMVPFEEPSAGLAIFYKKSFLKKALDVQSSASDADSSMTSPSANFDTPLFDAVPTGSMVVFVRADERLLDEIGNAPFPPPDRVGFSFGDDATLLVEGSEESLDGIDQWASRFRAMAETQVEGLQRRIDTEEMPESLGALIGYHYAYAYLETFEQQREDGRLTYSLAVPDTGASFMGPGILASVAIPAFLKYIKRSKVAEAEAITRKLADGARAYFASEQRGCKATKDCRSPWHRHVQAGMPIQFKDYTFPGGTDVHVVSMAEPPGGGAKAEPSPQFGPRHSSQHKDLDAILAVLGTSFSEPMYFKYSYETGPGSGVDATATVRAMADFKGDGEPYHTLQIELSIDPNTQDIRVLPTVVLNEFE